MNAADEIALCLICLFACKLFPFFINHAFSLMGSGVGGGGHLKNGFSAVCLASNLIAQIVIKETRETF